ncbi:MULTISPECIES: sulfatase-like hydrolase/transferase [Myxococcaceae]|uniref:sulfatase-like hydrolase/transferase n=1 Tax=Myxococcaceae TaxID=31 RepID=UPI00188ED0D5|nr:MULTISPECIES: sulfatase-like hydrolase/transferase [Myxococcaceae]MBF5041357.1 sulfatase-like hydrolase/transferase [Simulacricoccus sp. 17bor-14]
MSPRPLPSRPSRSPLRSALQGLRGLWPPLAGGALLGLVLFLAESALLVRAGTVGVNLDVSGPYAALMALVRPLLPPLLSRVLLAYLLGGAVLGAGAGLLARAWGRRGVLPVTLHWGVLFALLAWDRAIQRPALFDDVPAVRGALEWLTLHGEPWQPQVAAALWLLGHAVALLLRSRRGAAVGALAAAGAVGLMGGGWALPGAGQAPPAPPPLVVLIGVDAFRPDRLRALGGTGEVAPHLDAFVQEATLFTRAYTPIAQTEPAWRALLTARWPHRTGVRYPLTADARIVEAPTFAQAFGRAGYGTLWATDCSRFHFEGEASGFAMRLQPPRGAVNFLLEKLRYRALGLFADNRLGAWLLPEFIENRALAGVYDPRGYADRLASRMLRQAEAGPALLAFHATAAHFPGDPVYPFYRREVPATEPLERRVRMQFSPIAVGAKGGGSVRVAEGLYDELISQADAQVGALLDALKKSGRYDDALIVLLSDHGESFHSDHPELAGATPVHGARLHEEENRILLAVKLPRSWGRGPAQVDALVRLIDVGPTLLSVAGLPGLPGADGVSLAPLLKGESLPEPLRLYAETGFTHASPEVFEPAHLPGLARGFDNYQLRPDGVVEVTPEAHAAMLREKDRGAFDGESWLVEWPGSDGSLHRSCRGPCRNAALEPWFDAVLQRGP